MRKLSVQTRGFAPRTIIRVVLLQELQAEWRQDLQFVVIIKNFNDMEKVKVLINAGLNNVTPLMYSLEAFDEWSGAAVLDKEGKLAEGDVAAVGDDMVEAHILFRESDQHHTVFLTNQCNSNCLMCSQPPTLRDDSWLIDEACKIAEHMRISPGVLGFSGGEPLLLGKRLREVIDIFILKHPTTKLELLSNGRLLANEEFSSQLLKNLEQKVTWMIPLYGHADFLHDFVVQSYGAFEETLSGLLNLQAQQQQIQLRTVLIRPVLENLPVFCEFIGKNLPFVREVALMACEPIGFARGNRELSDMDLRDWREELEVGIKVLERYQVNVILMNTPLCALPERLWKFAHKSISDWKRTFDSECTGCSVKSDCSGLFSWYSKEKNAMKIQVIQGVVNV